MRHKLSIVLAIGFCALLLATTISTAVAAEKYVLAYWREMGANESFDKRRCVVRVFDESGNPVVGVPVNNLYPSTFGNTDTKGTLNLNLSADVQITMTGPGASTPASDVSPYMTIRRYDRYPWEPPTNPLRWNCSYELAYLQKAEETNPGTFQSDTFNCTVNTPANAGNYTAPYTQSLAYNSVNCANSRSDANFRDGTGGQTSYGQTFVANGDRVMTVGVMTVVTGQDPYRLNCQVFKTTTGGVPDLSAPISEIKRMMVDALPTMNVFTFGVNDCPVVDGRTYFVRFWSDSCNIQAHQCGGVVNGTDYGDVYPLGTAWREVNGAYTSIPAHDLMGFICCMNYGSSDLGNLTGIVKDNSGNPIASAEVKIEMLNRSTFTDANGAYSFLNVAPGTYSIGAYRLGNCPGSSTATVEVAQTTTVGDIICNTVTTNLISNPSFEDNLSLAEWTDIQWNPVNPGNASWFAAHDVTIPSTPWNPNFAYGGPARTGNRWIGRIVCGVGGPHTGMIRRTISNLTINEEYTLGIYMRTMYYAAGERPDYIWGEIGYDPGGGTDYNQAIWSGKQYPLNNWRYVAQTFTASTPNTTIFLRYSLDGTGGFWAFAQFDDIFMYEACPDQPITGSIADALTKADGVNVSLPNMIATIGAPTFPTGTFYIEEMDRSAGVRVVGTVLMRRAETANITGKMATNSDGERYIDATAGNGSVSYQGDATAVPETIAMTGRDVGGTSLNDYTLGVYQGKGLYNVGKIVTVFGKITYKDQAVSSAKFFYLDDGSGLYDGNGNAAATGIRIDMGAWTNPTAANALVTGVVMKKKLTNGNEVRVIRPIAASYVTGF